MALVVKDRVQETSSTTGTGTLTLSGAASGYQSFSSAIGNGNTTYYAISNGTDWEVGVGTVGSGTLSRDTVLESSNAGSLVDFIAGVKTVFCTYPAERSVNTEDIGVSIQAYDADTAKYDDATANFTGTLQNGGSNVLVDTDIGSTVEAYDSTILKSASIGVTVQAYDADTAKYDDATANFTGTLQNGGSNVVVDTDIGSTVQAYDADTAKYDDTTANFTGTLQNGGSNVVVDTDIGSTVQAYDSNLTSFVGTFTLPTTDGTANQVMKTDGAGNIGFTTITAGDAYVGSTNTFTANQIISVTDNTNAALRVTQLGDGDALRVEDEANPDSTPFVIKNDGKVGIGVSTPSYPLDITQLEAISRIYSTQAGKGAMRLFSTTTGTMYVGKDYEGSSGWWGSGGEYVIAGTGNYPIDFHTNSVKRMTISSSGGMSFGSTGTAYGTTGQVLTSNGNAPPTWGAALTEASDAEYVTGTDNTKFLTPLVARSRNIVQGTAVASTSGTSIDFTSIPSWVKRITVMFNGVSTNGSSVPQMQIGDSGGVETTSYNSFGTSSAITSGFALNNTSNSGASVTYFGFATIVLLGSNTWAYSAALGINAGGAAPFYAGGTKTLSDILDRVRITTVNGTDTFDAGSINILYE